MDDPDFPFRDPLITGHLANPPAKKKRGRKNIIIEIVFNNEDICINNELHNNYDTYCDYDDFVKKQKEKLKKYDEIFENI